MQNKKNTRKKIPEYLYHYTTWEHFQDIYRDGQIDLSPSNLKMDDSTLHIEGIFRGDEQVGSRLVDKYANYHPVVWFTADSNAVATENGLDDLKTQCVLVIKTAAHRHSYMSWMDFTSKYNSPPDVVARLKKSNGGGWKQWYIRETPIDVTEIESLGLKQANGEYVYIGLGEYLQSA